MTPYSLVHKKTWFQRTAVPPSASQIIPNVDANVTPYMETTLGYHGQPTDCQLMHRGVDGTQQ